MGKEILVWPQSNQRGIETTLIVGQNKNERRCLNRTSVGLKLAASSSLVWLYYRPQSNQRGIETVLSFPLRPLLD